jgi:hypothetical protein
MWLFFNKEQRFWCGSGIFFNPYEKTFNEACIVHDTDYLDWTISRKESDRQFLETMLAASDNKLINFFRAYLYYFLVRLFWRMFYKRS